MSLRSTKFIRSQHLMHLLGIHIHLFMHLSIYIYSSIQISLYIYTYFHAPGRMPCLYLPRPGWANYVAVVDLVCKEGGRDGDVLLPCLEERAPLRLVAKRLVGLVVGPAAGDAGGAVVVSGGRSAGTWCASCCGACRRTTYPSSARGRGVRRVFERRVRGGAERFETRGRCEG